MTTFELDWLVDWLSLDYTYTSLLNVEDAMTNVFHPLKIVQYTFLLSCLSFPVWKSVRMIILPAASHVQCCSNRRSRRPRGIQWRECTAVRRWPWPWLFAVMTGSDFPLCFRCRRYRCRYFFCSVFLSKWDSPRRRCRPKIVDPWNSSNFSIDGSIDWLIDWLMSLFIFDGLSEPLIDCLIDCVFGWSLDWRIDR